MGEKENKPFQLTFNGFLKVDFQGFARHLGWWPDSHSGTGRAARTGQADRRASDGFAARHKQEVPTGRPGAAIGLQPPRRLRGSQRCCPCLG